jgi:hypothetical protein
VSRAPTVVTTAMRHRGVMRVGPREVVRGSEAEEKNVGG